MVFTKTADTMGWDSTSTFFAEPKGQSQNKTRTGVPAPFHLRRIKKWLKDHCIAPVRRLRAGPRASSVWSDNSSIWDDEEAAWDSSSTPLPCAKNTWDDPQVSIGGSSQSSITIVSDEKTSCWDDSIADDNALTSASQTSWDHSYTSFATGSTETLATSLSSSSADTPPHSITINDLTISTTSHPILTFLLTNPGPLALSAASKHALATTLKRIVESACFYFMATHAPSELELLHIDSYDAIDINAWITLLHYLRSSDKIPEAAFAGELPVINKWFTEKIHPRVDTIGRLRQVAIHRWEYDGHLLLDVVKFLAVVKDNELVGGIEEILRAAYAPTNRTREIEEERNCRTKTEFLATLVRILEEALYRFAKIHCPDLDLEHAHALELQVLALACLSHLRLVFSIDSEEIGNVFEICRALRNAAAHHNRFSPEAIEGRKYGSSVFSRYDGAEDPYGAMAGDAEKVALILGDKSAAREIRLALYVADINIRARDSVLEDEREEGDEDEETDESQEPTDYLRLALRAEMAKRGLDRDEMGWEGNRTLCLRYSEAVAHFEQRAAEIIPGSKEIFERWSRDVVGVVEDPGAEIAPCLTW